MATVPSPMTWEAGHKPTSDDMNREIRDAISFLLNPPRVSLYLVDTQSIPNNSETKIMWHAEEFDTNNMWDVGDAGKVTIQVPGVYTLFGVNSFAPNSTGWRGILFRKNGSSLTAHRGNSVSSAAETQIALAIDVELDEGDYVESYARQTSGGNLDLSDGWTQFTVRWAAAL